MDIIEIDNEINTLLDNISKLTSKVSNLRKQKGNILFERVCNYINIDEPIVLVNGMARRFNAGDVIKVIKKNKKTIVISVVSRRYLHYKDEGIIYKIQSHIFGKSIYSIPRIKIAVDRDQVFKKLEL